MKRTTSIVIFLLISIVVLGFIYFLTLWLVNKFGNWSEPPISSEPAVTTFLEQYDIYYGGLLLPQDLVVSRATAITSKCPTTGAVAIDTKDNKIATYHNSTLCVTDSTGELYYSGEVINGDNYFPYWSPDGKRVLLSFEWLSDFAVFDYSTKSLKYVSLEDNPKLVGIKEASHVVWEASSHVLFPGSDSNGKPNSYRLNIDTMALEVLATNRAVTAVSPLGDKWLSYPLIVDPGTNKRVGSINWEVFEDEFWRPDAFKWSPDGKYILLVGQKEMRLFCTTGSDGCVDTFMYLYSAEENKTYLVKQFKESLYPEDFFVTLKK